MKSGQWFRLYAEVLNDPKVQFLPPDLFKHWVNILCIASKNDGVLPEIQDIAFALRETLDGAVTVIERLLNGGLIDKLNGGNNGWHYAPHGWNKRQYKSDTSTERVKRFRENNETFQKRPQIQKQNTEADTEKNNTKNGGVEVDLFSGSPSARMLGEAPRQASMSDEERERLAQFENFWAAYPKQRPGSKGTARRRYWSALKITSHAEIMAGLHRYCASDQVGRGFAKGCAAWLNDEGWVGSYAAPTPTKPTASQHQTSKHSETV